ncbi:MAG TPA: AAA family ATPase [Candidatus Sumerlaeota bacterium]|nr:MAG: ATP-dependent zinc metalloprotease FtsH 1 [candidate division BRC1 bacterium ADurb.Bin183]HOE62665.1 AAA family ATPase [Candidatus Sumerlaeota bacterium]HRR29971.1 AAA family ATPase [Candidatus Sumerlaeia bacterium]HON49425.1 AAA family ATPase [Candidatus Sumerlaeota bacterium]HOR64825.1 AAA family ATPase [Candidatus Sumerlaeota bacterium]
MSPIALPKWAQDMKDIFRSETISQFVVSGSIHDLVPVKSNGGGTDFVPLRQFMTDVLFIPFDVVIFYDRGKGITIPKGMEHFQKYLEVFDGFHGSRFAGDAGVYKNAAQALDSPGLLPRDPTKALELIDRFINNIAAVARTPNLPAARSVAVVIDYANFIAPAGESLYIYSEIACNLVKILNWAKDPVLQDCNIITTLLTENLSDLNKMIVESPYSAKVAISLPDRDEIEEYLKFLLKDEKKAEEVSEIPLEAMAERLVGLSRINVKTLLMRAIKKNEKITQKYLTQVKREIIEKEAFGLIEFIESKHTLDDVAGHVEAKKWLRQDAQLLKRGALRAIPMGYLICGRIGTGKTYLIECFAGECGIPFVAMKNFREKWVGATEGNLEKIFHILRALGQVVVFIDEADQATGRRDAGEGDSGLSGRIYGMLAKEMSDTKQRGKILWIFATSRPDLLEVDLKRQGRLDVHIPLFPPTKEDEIRDLFIAMGKKAKLDLKAEDIPPLHFKEPISGNEIEGLLIRAVREFEVQPECQPQQPIKDILAKILDEFRPSAHTALLELMDLNAVKECTDDRFLPPPFRDMDKLAVERRIQELLLLAGRSRA